jgi:hypothetical protein
MMMRFAALCGLVAGAHAHGSMIMPPSRNSVDAELDAWSHGKFPETGLIECVLVAWTKFSPRR